MYRIAILAVVAALAVVRPAAAQSPAGAERLEFKEMLVATSRALEPSSKLKSLAGKRVEVVGYAAQMEQPPLGGFFLVPAPLFADESGGGTADLPLEAIFVVVPSAAGRALAAPPGPVRVTGPLELGYREEPGGVVTRVRIVADAADSVAVPAVDDNTNAH